MAMSSRFEVQRESDGGTADVRDTFIPFRGWQGMRTVGLVSALWSTDCSAHRLP